MPTTDETMIEPSTETSEQRRWIAEGMRRAVNACEELEASARSDIETTLDTAIGMSVAKTTIQIMQKRMLDLAERTEHVKATADDARDAEYWRWLMRNLDAGEGGPDTVVTGLLFDRPAEEWPTVVAEQIKRESQDAEREIRPVLSGCMVRAAEQMFERGDQPDISSTPAENG